MCLIGLRARAADDSFSEKPLTSGFRDNAILWFSCTLFLSLFTGSSWTQFCFPEFHPHPSILTDFSPADLYDFDWYLLAKLLLNWDLEFPTSFAKFHTTFALAHWGVLGLPTSAVSQTKKSKKELITTFPAKSALPYSCFSWLVMIDNNLPCLPN